MKQENADEFRRAVARLHRTTGAPITYGGLVDNGKFFHLSDLFGTTTDSLTGLAIHVGRGLGGRALALGRPVAVSDYQHATVISHDYDQPVRDEGVRSAIAVPVVVRRVVRAMIYGARREAGLLSDRAIQAAIAAARELEQDMAVRDEVDRRIALLERHYTSVAPSHHRDSLVQESVRHAHAELRILAAKTADEDVRRRILNVCVSLSNAADPTAGTGPVALAPRELDVLSCVALGHTNGEIASELGLETETVKSYLRSAMRKLDANTRVQAVVAARRAGLLP